MLILLIVLHLVQSETGQIGYTSNLFPFVVAVVANGIDRHEQEGGSGRFRDEKRGYLTKVLL
jgi:hypothetical protein